MDNGIIFTNEAAYIGKLEGIVTVPEDFDPEKESLPVIVFLHGAGEVTTGEKDSVQKVKTHGVPKYFSEDPQYKGLRVITVSPQCPNGFIWDQITLQLKDYIDKAVEKFNGDRSKISVTGISMGGYGTWNMITTFPEYFCCAAPICGGGVAWRAASNPGLKGKKIWALHSTDDRSVFFNFSLEMIQHAEYAGADVKLTAFSGLGHGCWNEAYENTELLRWLASGGTD